MPLRVPDDLGQVSQGPAVEPIGHDAERRVQRRDQSAGREDVLLTCHMGSCSDEGRKAMELGAARAVAAFLRGEPLPDRVV